MKVLLVDDHEMVRLGLKSFVHANRYQASLRSAKWTRGS